MRLNRQDSYTPLSTKAGRPHPGAGLTRKCLQCRATQLVGFVMPRPSTFLLCFYLSFKPLFLMHLGGDI